MVIIYERNSYQSYNYIFYIFHVFPYLLVPVKPFHLYLYLPFPVLHYNRITILSSNNYPFNYSFIQIDTP